MKYLGRVILACLVLSVLLSTPAALVFAQEQVDMKTQLRGLVGTWAAYPRDTGATPPDPPPVHASYADRSKLKPLSSVARVILRLENDKLTGKAILPQGVVLSAENADVSERPEVPLRDLKYEDGRLTFQATVDDKVLKVDVKSDNQRRFLGTWMTDDGKSGDFFLARRDF